MLGIPVLELAPVVWVPSASARSGTGNMKSLVGVFAILILIAIALLVGVRLNAQGRWNYNCFYTLSSAVGKLNSLSAESALTAKLAVYDETSTAGHHCVVYRQ